MDEQMTSDDFDLILDALKNTKRAYEDYGKYSSYEFKQEQLKRVDAVTKKVKVLRAKLLEN